MRSTRDTCLRLKINEQKSWSLSIDTMTKYPKWKNPMARPRFCFQVWSIDQKKGSVMANSRKFSWNWFHKPRGKVTQPGRRNRSPWKRGGAFFFKLKTTNPVPFLNICQARRTKTISREELQKGPTNCVWSTKKVRPDQSFFCADYVKIKLSADPELNNCGLIIRENCCLFEYHQDIKYILGW